MTTTPKDVVATGQPEEAVPPQWVSTGQQLTAWRLERRRNLTQAERTRNEHVLEAMPIADKVAHRYAGARLELEDARQAACEGLVEGAQTFDPSRGTWPTRAWVYAVNGKNGVLTGWCRGGSVTTARKAARVRKHSKSLEYQDELHAPLVHSPEDGMLADELRELFLGALSQRERRVFELLEEGHTFKEIRTRLHISQHLLKELAEKCGEEYRRMTTANARRE